METQELLLASNDSSAGVLPARAAADHPLLAEPDQGTSDVQSTEAGQTEAGQTEAACSTISVLSDAERQAVTFVPSFGSSDGSGIGGSMCRICHEGGAEEALLSPCHCSGSVKHVHQTCLQQWLQAGASESCGGAGRPGSASGRGQHCDRCELCGYNFVMTSRIKPFRKWKKLKMTSVERRKVLCSVTFHAVAITCVVWSLYVLIDRTTQEIQEGNLQWPFWTKLVVVAIGFTGGLVFMYVQCKMYVQLFRKWRAYNRVIQIQSLASTIATDKSTLEGVPVPLFTLPKPPTAAAAALLHDSQQLPV